MYDSHTCAFLRYDWGSNCQHKQYFTRQRPTMRPSLLALEKIAEELDQDAKLCRLTVEIMAGYTFNPNILLAEIQSQPVRTVC